MYVNEMHESYSHLEGVSSGIIFGNKGIFNITGFPTFDLQIPGALLHFPPELYFLKKDVVGVSSYFLQIVPNHLDVGISSTLYSNQYYTELDGILFLLYIYQLL